MKQYKIELTPIATLALIGVFIGGANAAISSTFDSDLDGWTGTGGAVTHVSTAGNPGGFLSMDDNEGTWMTVSAPAAYHGNLSSYIDGVICFDAKNLNGTTPNGASTPYFGTITISGTGGIAEFTLGGQGNPPADFQWHSYSAPLDPGLWIGDLSGAMSDVSAITVVLESADRVNGEAHAEINGFDNFAIKVPEPSGVILLGPGGCHDGFETQTSLLRHQSI